MKNWRLFLRVLFIAGFAVFALVPGCIFDSKDLGGGDPEGNPPPEYVTPDTPENALHNFYVAQVTRDLEGYDAVLASDFVYLFPSDLPLEQMGSCDGEWTREEELAAAEALFGASSVTGIYLDLPEAEAVPSTEIGMPEGAMLIRLTGARFSVDDRSGTTFAAYENTVYDLVFRPGMAGAGEDPASWYLFLWREMPRANAPSGRGLDGSSLGALDGPAVGGLGAPTPVQPTSWWQIKCDWGA
jgi:hypothetical protein